MRKAEAKHRHTHKLERLQRFLNWTTERHPDFAPKKNHQEKWFSTYLGFQPPEIGRAARLFWLGLDDATVEANLEGAAPASLIGRLLNRDVNDFSCTVDIFGVEKTLDCGPVQNLLEPEFTLRIEDSRSTDEFEHNVCAAVQTLVRDRLHVLENPSPASVMNRKPSAWSACPRGFHASMTSRRAPSTSSTRSSTSCVMWSSCATASWRWTCSGASPAARGMCSATRKSPHSRKKTARP